MPASRYLALGLTALLFPALATAHHGFAAHYDGDRPVLIDGVVTDFKLVNPHAFVYVETTNEAGETETWWCEMQARSQLHIKGITQESIKPGDRIRIEGFAARRDPRGCEFATGYLADGKVLALRTSGAQSLFAAPALQDDSRSIEGTWFRKSFPGAGTDPDPEPLMTPAALAAHAANDPVITNPVYRCSPISPVRAWSQPGLPTQIRRDGDRVIIHHEFMDTVRVVHLGLDQHPRDAPRSEMGHSIGRLEEDGTLVVETAKFSEGAVRATFLHTEDFELVERLAINPENGDLEVTWTATDPAYYDGPLEGSRILMRTSLPMGSYDCVPQAADAHPLMGE